METLTERIIHVRTDDGSMLCGKDRVQFRENEYATGPYWQEVNCPRCNDRRRLNFDQFMNISTRSRANKNEGPVNQRRLPAKATPQDNR